MLGLVLVRVAVPPAPVGPGALGDTGLPPGRLRFGTFGLLDDRLPRRNLPSSPSPACRRGGATRPVRPRASLVRGPAAWGIVPVMRRTTPGGRLRALTLPGCPRMLQVALRACAPQT
ncbi:hypothetical protein CP969_11070 [Streptomyces viridosporus T7A]|uniref:Secreted protein n=1 Tax=Streptomyces viridosporus T7A TaxID=665577 RepID=A0ABX6AC12_STRVD|nr:hypothetical protein CP969_11070 [Streptomyces viridosporus T7A]